MQEDLFGDMRKKIIQFLLYELRWISSTPILAICLILLGGLGEIPATIIANFIGGVIFFGVDKLIFKEKKCRDRK